MTLIEKGIAVGTLVVALGTAACASETGTEKPSTEHANEAHRHAGVDVSSGTTHPQQCYGCHAAEKDDAWTLPIDEVEAHAASR